MKKLLTFLAIFSVLGFSPSWADNVTHYIKFLSDNNIVVSTGNDDDATFFTYNKGEGNSVSFSTNYHCTYQEEEYSKTIKMESATQLYFTTTGVATVTIVQPTSTDSGNYLSFDDNTLSSSNSTIFEDNENTYREYTITDVQAGTHYIKRGSGQAGLAYVKVEEAPDTRQELTITGSNTVQKGATIAISVTATDESSNPVSGLAFTYQSGNENVATIATDGTITGVAMGNTSITVTFDGDTNYKPATGTVSVEVTAPETPGTMIIASDSYSINVGNTRRISVNATDSGTGKTIYGKTYSFSSDDDDVATVTSDGTITAVASGTATITISFAGDQEYYAATGTVAVTVTNPEPLTLSVADRNIIVGSQNPFVVVATSNGNAITTFKSSDFTYSSDNTSAVTVDGYGRLKGIAAGSATITVNFAGNDTYAASTTTFTATAVAPTSTANPIVNWSFDQYQNGTAGDFTLYKNEYGYGYCIERSAQTMEDGKSFTPSNSAVYGANGYLAVGNVKNDNTGYNNGNLEISLSSLTNGGKYLLTFKAHNVPEADRGGRYELTLTGATTTASTNHYFGNTGDTFSNNDPWIDVEVPFTTTSTNVKIKFDKQFFLDDVLIRQELKLDTGSPLSVVKGSTVAIPTVYEQDGTTAVTGKTITYASSDDAVATVDANTGVITGVAGGTTTITATFAGDNEYAPTTAEITVTVTDPDQYHYSIQGADSNGDGTYAAIEYTITANGNLPAHETVDVGSLITVKYSDGTWTVADDGHRNPRVPAAQGTNPTSFDTQGLPTDGCFIMFTPKVYGTLSIDANFYSQHYYELKGYEKNGNKVTYSFSNYLRNTTGNVYGYQTYDYILKPGVTYYFYSRGSSNYNIAFHGFKFAPVFAYSEGDRTPTTTVTAYYNLDHFNSFPNVLAGNKAVTGVSMSFTSSNTDLATVNPSTGIVDLPTQPNDNGAKTTTITSSTTCDTKEVGANGAVSNQATCTVKTSYVINASYNETAYRVTEPDKDFYTEYATEVAAKASSASRSNISRTYGDIILTWGGCDWTTTTTDKGWCTYTQHNTGRSTSVVWDGYQTSDSDENGDIEGFAYFYYGRNNPKDERAYNWGFGPTSKDDETEAAFNDQLWGGKRFNIPCRGTYFRFEPTANGRLTVYLQQNGSINKNENDRSVINTATFSYRPIYILDETGNAVTLQDASTKAKVYFDASDMPNSDDIVNNSLEKGYYDAVYPYWSATSGDEYTHGKNTPCHFLMVADPTQLPSSTNLASEVTIVPGTTKAEHLFLLSGGMVKYSFDVQAGKTYFVFGQRTKLGLSGFVLDKSATAENTACDIDETASSMPSPGTYESITLQGRSFTAGKWAAICLPFSVSEAQVYRIFGAEAKVAYFTNTENGHMTMGRHAYNMILAGTPCFLKPSQSVTSPTFTHVTIESNIYTGVGNSYTANAAGTEGEYSRTDGASGDYAWTGTYATGNVIQAGDYFISGGNLWKNDGTTAKTLKACRAWLSRTNTSAPDLNGETFEEDAMGETTAIEGITILDTNDNDATMGRQGVYNLNGQYLGTSTEHLGKGIYIVNGNKTIIK